MCFSFLRDTPLGLSPHLQWLYWVLSLTTIAFASTVAVTTAVVFDIAVIYIAIGNIVTTVVDIIAAVNCVVYIIVAAVYCVDALLALACVLGLVRILLAQHEVIACWAILQAASKFTAIAIGRRPGRLWKGKIAQK